MSENVDHGAKQSQTVSASDFSAASMLFCDRYSLAADQLPTGEEDRLFDGHLRSQAMSSGINLSTANIKALRDSDHAVVFPRSLSLVVSLEGRPSEVNTGNGREKIILQPGEAALFSFSDEEQTQGRYVAGHCSKSVLIQLRPSAIFDESLAEFVERRVQSSEMLSLGTNKRVNSLSQELFSDKLTGTIGRLLTESYALELIARAMQSIDDAAESASHSVKETDRKRMARVRQMIIDDPGAPHSLQSLAREAGVSVSGLKTKFRQVYDQPVFAFLHDVRMVTARSGIELEGWTVTQAAHFTGYSHASNFSTAFQKYFGRSPGMTGNRTIYPSS
jgi:AraC-like DNA-binding protein